MGVIGIILLVVFVIICILLVCLVLVQNDEGGGMGGLLGGASSTAFGSRSGNVLTRTTYVLVALFFVCVFGLALLNRTPEVKDLAPEVSQEVTESANGFWSSDETTETPAVTESAAAEVTE